LAGVRVTLALCLIIWAAGLSVGVLLGVVGANHPALL